MIGGSCHKYNFCRDKDVFVATNMCLSRQTLWVVLRQTRLLSRQKRAGLDKTFVAIKLCLHTFVATKHVFCRDEHVFVATKMILVAAQVNDSGEEMGRTGD